MPAEGDQEFLDLYARELAYLRERGAEFSAAYPKVASRLGISGIHGSDPHVERLLESFAFLTARIQRGIEADFPEITTSLLGVLYPQYQSPVPAMAIASFESDKTLTSGHTVPRHTRVFAEASGGEACWFRTTSPVTVWPIEIGAASFVAPELIDIPTSMSGVAAALRIQIDSAGPKLSELGIRTLRVYLNGSGITIARLYEYLFTRD
ncbi:MAG: type VI secretion system baseplate subunit TssF, partial [Byssovorax sp.]